MRSETFDEVFNQREIKAILHDDAIAPLCDKLLHARKHRLFAHHIAQHPERPTCALIGHHAVAIA